MRLPGDGPRCSRVMASPGEKGERMAEQILYKQGDVFVSQSRFMVKNQTYAMQGVTSVRQDTKPANRTGAYFLAGLGILFLIGSGQSAVFAVLGILSIALAILVWFLTKPTYIIVLRSSSGEAQALSSNDGNYIDEVVTALNQAIIARG